MLDDERLVAIKRETLSKLMDLVDPESKVHVQSMLRVGDYVAGLVAEIESMKDPSPSEPHRVDKFAEYLYESSEKLMGSARMSDYAAEIGAEWDRLRGLDKPVDWEYLPERVRKDLREFWLENEHLPPGSTEEMLREKTMQTSAEELFDIWLTWNGIIGYLGSITVALDGIRAARK